MTIDVGVYYFPGYHPNPITDRLHGAGWTEWDVLSAARPRFPGHAQPIRSAWGEFDESDPAWAQRQADLAVEHGIDFFIYDWYWYENNRFLNSALDNGLLAPSVSTPLRFALMWANHDWLNIHPASSATVAERLFSGAVTGEQFDALADEVVQKYFLHERYYRIDGAPYFSIYEPQTLIEGLGSVEAAAAALDRLRERARAAGIPSIHINFVVTDRSVLPGERMPGNRKEVVDLLGADSTTTYVWIHHKDPADYGFPRSSYTQMALENERLWPLLQEHQAIPYYPNVTVGWDSSPRAVQSDVYEDRGYPWMAVLDGNTPEAFENALGAALDYEAATGHAHKVVTINAWNEWTEGSYLLPDDVHGLAYLQACLREKLRVSGVRATEPDQTDATAEAARQA